LNACLHEAILRHDEHAVLVSKVQKLGRNGIMSCSPAYYTRALQCCDLELKNTVGHRHADATKADMIGGSRDLEWGVIEKEPPSRVKYGRADTNSGANVIDWGPSSIESRRCGGYVKRWGVCSIPQEHWSCG
jgi:hypothetical protein